MGLTLPIRLADGVGNVPAAANWNDDYDWLTSLALGLGYLLNGGQERWSLATSFTNPANGAQLSDNWTLIKTGTSLCTADVTREGTIVDTGLYSMKVNITGAGSSDSYWAITQGISSGTRFQSQTVVAGARVRCATASKVRVKVTDGTTTAYSSYHTGDGTWQLLQAKLAVGATASAVTVTVEINPANFTDAVYIDSGYFYVVPSAISARAQSALVYSPLLDIPAATAVQTFRNRVYNGACIFDQANGGAVATVNSSSSVYTVDGYGRAFGQASDGVFTLQQLSASPPAGFQYYMRVKTTTADSSVTSGQFYYQSTFIEGNFCWDFFMGTAAAVTFTISFWARSSLTGQFGGCVGNSAANRSYPFTYTINNANTWEQKTITIAGDTTGTWATDNNPGLVINWDWGSGSTYLGTPGSWSGSNFIGATSDVKLIGTVNATMDITGLQCEIGSSATPFEVRPWDQEFRLCERYYEKTYLFSRKPGTDISGSDENTEFWSLGIIGTTNTQTGVRFRTEKRAAPTVTVYTETGTSGSLIFKNSVGSTFTVSVSPIVIGTQSWVMSQASGAYPVALGHWVADARL